MTANLDNRRDTIRRVINSSAGRFCRVEFVKKDGTKRHALVQPAASKFHVKGAAASESAQKATATRAKNNPNLFNYWDCEKLGFRSLNLDTVTRIAVNGLEINLPEVTS